MQILVLKTKLLPLSAALSLKKTEGDIFVKMTRNSRNLFVWRLLYCTFYIICYYHFIENYRKSRGLELSKFIGIRYLPAFMYICKEKTLLSKMEYQSMTAKYCTNYTERDFFRLFQNIILMIYQTHLVWKKQIAIPSFSYCHCKETQACLLPL